MTNTRGGRSILDIIDDALDVLNSTPPAPAEAVTCNQNHDTEHLYYKRPFRGSPDTILACRACDTENAIDAQQHPEPSDLYEN